MKRALTQTFGITAVMLAANVLSGAIAARALAPQGRGQLAAILTTPNIATVLFAMGASQALSYEQAKRPHLAARSLGTWLVMAVPFSLLAIGTIEAAIPLLLSAQDSETIFLARLWAFGVAVSIFAEVFNGMLLGSHDFLAFNLFRLLSPLLITVGYSVCYALDVLTVRSALIVTICSFLLTISLSAVRVIARHGVALPDWKFGRMSAWYGFKARSGVTEAVNARLDILLLPAFLGAASVGLYSVATNVSWIVVALGSALGSVTLPIIAARDAERGALTSIKAVHFTLALAICGAAPIALLADPALRIVYGEPFESAATALRLLLPGCVMFAGVPVLAAGLSALGRPGLAALIQLPGAIVTVAGLALFVKGGGIEAAALISTVAYGTVFVGGVISLKSVGDLRWRELAPSLTDLRAAASAVLGSGRAQSAR